MDIIYLACLMLVLGACASKLSDLSIRVREKRYPQLVLSVAPALKGNRVKECTFVSGSAVVSLNAVLAMVLAVRSFFGGNIGSYERLLARSRRLALLRMKEAAPQSDFFVGVRLELNVLSIAEGRFRNFPKIEVLAYGTAIRTKPKL